MTVQSSWMRGFAILAFFGLAGNALVGDPPEVEPPPAKATGLGAIEQESAYAEIHRIRQQLGGSVLRGSVLESGDDGKADAFEDQVRSSLGLPPLPRNAKEESSVHFSSESIVKKLRLHSTQLDRVANEIESLRQYENADQLRATAKELRLIARQFDIEPANAAKRGRSAAQPRKSR